MARSKHAKPDEELLGEIRSLNKLVKSLRQRIKQLEKQEHIFEQELSTAGEPEELPIGKQQVLCEDCSKGYYLELDLNGKIYGTCQTCGYHKRLK